MAGTGSDMIRSEVHGLGVARLADEGPLLGTEQDALDLIGATYGHDIDLLIIPVGRLQPDFFRLRTGMAGGFLQKMQNYGLRVAIVGDITPAIAASEALADFVRESNRIGAVLFVPDEAALQAHIGADVHNPASTR